MSSAIGSPGVAEELAALGAASLSQSGAIALNGRLRPMWSGARLVGPAQTVECAAGDNLAIHAALAEIEEGAVLAVSVHAELAMGYFGEVMSRAAQHGGAAGLAIGATVRDVAAMERLCFPVFAHGVALPSSSKRGPGRLGGSISLGGVTISPGDWLVGDVDGLVVIRAGELASCLKAARALAEREQELFLRLSQGEHTCALLGLDVSSIERARAIRRP